MDTPTLYVVSDGRGDTAVRLLKSALVQFPGQAPHIVRHGDVLAPDQVKRIVGEAARDQATVFFTLVSTKTRDAMRECSRDLVVPVVDLLGPIMAALRDTLRTEPLSTPGLFYETEREHFDRIEAIDYTLNHDDGRNPDSLGAADVVLVGVSRASKSSTSYFLGYHGVRAANVPLIPDMEPQRQLLEVDPAKVVGLTINKPRLRTVREVRARHLGSRFLENYVNDAEIAREIHHALDLMHRHGWRTVDVSYKAIEEVAREVVELLGLPVRLGR